MNRRKLVSLILSLLIHLIILTVLFLVTHRAKKEMTSSGAQRVELSLKDFVAPPPSRPAAKPTPPVPPQPKPLPPRPQPKPEPKPVQKPKQPEPRPQPKPEPEPKVEPKQEEKPKPKTEPKKEKSAPKPKPKPTPLKKPVAKPKPKPKPQPVPPPPPPSKPVPKKPESPESALAGALGAPAMPQQAKATRSAPPPSIEQINNSMSDREFHALYKDEFDHYTPNQKKFIKSNLNRIQAITQHYLTMRGYPPFAVQQRMQGVNIVEFFLHPNGDITDLKVISSSGFDVLDDNSLDTIRTAYKDYPRPKETTKIRFYIHYQIY